MKRLMVSVAVVTSVLVGSVYAQGPSNSANLPANQWVNVGEKAGGCRVGSAVVCLEQQKRFLVIAGLRQDK